MPISVRVQNFQSISDATLVIDRFTAITGPNNTGKSAFFRAVQGLFRNTKGSSFVRRGAAFCSVTITFDDGVSITWEKGRKVNRYRIGDEDWLDKVSHGVPAPVEKLLRVRAVNLGSTAYWPQIGKQFDGQVFLLDKPGSVLAEAISDVERVGRLNRALKVAESEKRKAKSTLRVRDKDEAKIQEQLVQFHGLADVGREIAALSVLREQTQKVRSALVELVQLRGSLQREAAVIQRFSGVREVSFPEEALFAETKESLHLHQFLLSARANFLSATKEVRVLEDACAAYEQIDFEDELEAHTERLLKSLQVLQGMRLDMQEASQKVERAAREVAKATQALELSNAELQGVLQEMPECPVCGAGIEGREGLCHEHS